MVKRILTRDSITGACELAELTSYPVVTGTGATSVTATVAADGMVTYTVNSDDTFATYAPATRTITFADGQTVVLPENIPNPVVVGSAVTSIVGPDGTVVYTVADTPETPNPTVSAAAGGGTTVTQTTNPDGSINYVVSAAGIDEDSCYVIPEITNACNVVEVGYVVDGAGCGRLVQITERPLPSGFQYLQNGINGTFRTPFTEATGDRSARIEAQIVDPDGQAYEILPIPAIINLNTTEFCGLAVAGTVMRVTATNTIGYWLDSALNVLKNIGAYQYGIAIFVDGVVQIQNVDAFAMNSSGNNSFLSDTQSIEFTTTGANMTIEVVPFIRANTGRAQYTINDAVEIDMGQTFVTWEKV